MLSYQYKKFHCGDKTILWLSSLHNVISYTGNTASFYWIGPCSICKLHGVSRTRYQYISWEGGLGQPIVGLCEGKTSRCYHVLCPWYHIAWLYGVKCPECRVTVKLLLGPPWTFMSVESNIYIYITYGSMKVEMAIIEETLNTLRPRQMATISQTTFSNAFSWIKIYEFQLRFHWSLFLGVQTTISQHWVR